MEDENWKNKNDQNRRESIIINKFKRKIFNQVRIIINDSPPNRLAQGRGPLCEDSLVKEKAIRGEKLLIAKI